MPSKTRIANPIYDVVFRYMMEDNKVAKLFLSAVVGETIEELIFNPTSYSSKIGDNISITLIRMDFSAKIKTADGTEKIVLIELQKAKYYYQTMRFRKYLGKQYQNPENVRVTTSNDESQKALPIYPIYLLGSTFSASKLPVIRVKRAYIDAATGKVIEERHPFIEALTHDAIVIQIPYLKNSRRTVLEEFLSIFDQSQQEDTKGHILGLKEEDYPQKYRLVIRRLNRALQNANIEEEMDMEDEVLNEFHRKDKLIEAARKATEQERQKAEQERQKAEQERQKAEQERQKAEQERESKQQLILHLHELGQPIETIAAVAGMPVAEIAAILKA